MYNKYANFVLAEWLFYIQNINPMVIDLTLDRVREVAINLKLLPFNIYTILIGGTNGKGSTCFLLEKILLKNNIRVGLYTSPHLLFFQERIRVCGKVLSIDIYIQVISIIEKARNNIKLTYFEFITLSALYIYKKYRLDVVILEVGVGGRLDATNIVDPNISVITNIEMDHMDLLGKTRNDIAVEKSGIFRSHKLAIIGAIDYPSTVNQIARDQRVQLFRRGQNWTFYQFKNQWSWIDCDHYKACVTNLPLPTYISLENAAVVLSILRYLPFSISRFSVNYALENTVVLGRFQIINVQPLIILDVGHNPHAAIYTVNKLSKMLSDKGVVRVVIGMLYNKDIKSTIQHLSKIVDIWYCAVLDTPLSVSVKQLSSFCTNMNVKCFKNIIDAWNAAILNANINDCILVFGSFYAVSSILKKILYNERYSKKCNEFLL